MRYVLQTQIAQSRVVIRPAAQRPTEEPIFFPDREIIDAGVADFREPRVIEFPILIPIRSIPLAGSVVRLVGEADSDPAPGESPQLLDEAVIQLPSPFSVEESNDLGAAVQKFRAVAPVTVKAVPACDSLRVARVPVVLDRANFQDRRLLGERRQEARHRFRLCIHSELPIRRRDEPRLDRPQPEYITKCSAFLLPLKERHELPLSWYRTLRFGWWSLPRRSKRFCHAHDLPRPASHERSERLPAPERPQHAQPVFRCQKAR